MYFVMSKVHNLDKIAYGIWSFNEFYLDINLDSSKITLGRCRAGSLIFTDRQTGRQEKGAAWPVSSPPPAPGTP